MLHIQGKGSYKYVVSPLKCMSDSDLNDKFREYYAENGISAEQVANFDMNKLDYVHWGHHAVAFPSFRKPSTAISMARRAVGPGRGTLDGCGGT